MVSPIPRFSWNLTLLVGVALLGAAACFAGWATAPRAKSWVPRLEEALAAGRIPPYPQITRVWLPRAALANGCLALVIAALVPLARSGRPEKPAVPSDSKSDRRARLRTWVPVAVIAAVGALSVAPRLHQSVWGDEDETMRRSVVGEFERTADGQLKFQPRSWKDTLFYYRNPNNHVLFSIVARLSHELFAPGPVEAEDAYFSEWALRLPAWIAGVLAVFSVAGLAAALGWRWPALLAAALLILHPWWFRYSAEARGYAFVLAGLPALITCLVQATRTGRWRWWWLAAALDFALLYTWPLSLHAVAAANLAALAAVWWCPAWNYRERVSIVVRWVITGMVAAMVFLQLFLPHLIALRAYLKRPRAMGGGGDGAISDAIAALFTGRVWLETDSSNSLLTPWTRVWATHPSLVLLGGLGLIAVLVAGVWRIWGAGSPGRVWLVALLLPAPLVIVHSVVSGSLLLPWYLMPALPGLLVVLAVGIERLCRPLSRSVPATLAAGTGGVLLIGLLGAPQRARLRENPIEPNREAALLVQPTLNPWHPDYQREVLTGGFLMQISAYDPGVREFQSVDALHSLLAEATRTGRDFAVTFGQMGLARQAFPEIMRVLDDRAVFEPMATLPGLEAYCTRYVYRRRTARSDLQPAD